jgi:OmcA/MtrC family decaheme c-type cytochrome
MQKRMSKVGGALFFAGVLAISGCSGSNGSSGTNGTNGMSAAGGKLKLTIDGVATATANGTTTSTVTFTVYPAAAVCPGGACDPTLSNLGQKTFYATEYDPATKTFTTAKNFSFYVFKFKGITADGQGAQYTAANDGSNTKTAAATFAPEASKSAVVYGYVADSLVMPANGNYKLYDSMSSAAKVYGTVDYQSTANVAGCEKCHGKPYSKHGYRQATVAGLNDFVSCKSCHTDQRVGNDNAWYQLADDPAAYAAGTAASKTTYAYTANLMNDVHNSHAFEFAYPQSMSNCVTCHEGKLDQVLTDANFKPTVCKSCHPVTGPAAPATVEAGRAPAMKGIWTAKNVAGTHTMDLYAAKGDGDCNGCHKAGGIAKTFSQLHTGYNQAIYAADGSRYSKAITTKVDSSSFDKATNLLTVNLSITGAAAQALIKPTVVVSLYGYNTKDFVVSGHGTNAADGTSLLEFTEGAMQRGNPTLSANSARLQVAPLMTAGNASWTVTADLTTWAAMITDGRVKRVEVGFYPALGLNQTVAPDNSATTGTPAVANPNYNPYIAIAGTTATIDLATGTVVTNAYGKAIVDPAKCNACHDALGTTFHAPTNGSAGVVGCRLCHWVGAGGSHLEMQSRSIDSYVHAIHSMQAFDIGNVNFADSIQKLWYSEHIDANYPNFAGPQNCESCHNPGTYDVPDQTKSLPSILSKAATLTGTTRNINGVQSEVVGPASRACGSCHRAQAINEDDAGKLAAFNSHTAQFGMWTLAGSGTTNLDAVTQTIQAQIAGGPAFTGTMPAGVVPAVESCEVCHPTGGASPLARLKAWGHGTVLLLWGAWWGPPHLASL